MTMYDDSRVVTLLREIEPPLAPPNRLGEVRRRARRAESRRASVLAGVMAVVLASGVVSALSLRDAGTTETLTVAGAAKATAQARTARMTMEIRFSGQAASSGLAGTYKISGLIDFEKRRYALKGSYLSQAYETRGIGKDVWVKQPTLPGKSWLHMTDTSSSTGSSSSFTSFDPAEMLDALTKQAVTQSSHREGDRTIINLRVRGGVLDSSEDRTSLHDVTVTVDDQDRVRRLETSEDMGELGRARFTLTFDDFGTAVDVRPPPADQVGEFADLLSNNGPLGTSEGCTAFLEQQRKLLAKVPESKRKEIEKAFEQAAAACKGKS